MHRSGDIADEALAAALDQVGLDPVLFAAISTSRGRTGYRTPELGLFARVDEVGYEERARHEVRFAKWSEPRSLPILRIDPRYPDQPIITASGSVTLWPLAQPVRESEIDPDWFGHALRRLHTVNSTSAPSVWNPGLALRTGLEGVRQEHSICAESLSTLTSEVDRVLLWLDGPGSALDMGVIHGDASPDNTVCLDGTPLLIDFEKAGIGPVAYDLSPVRVLAKRFGLHSEFADRTTVASGVSVQLGAQAMLDRLFELSIILGAIAPYAARPVFRDEFELRIRRLDDEGAGWTSHRELLAI